MKLEYTRTDLKSIPPKFNGNGYDLTAISKQRPENDYNDVIQYNTGLSFNIPKSHIGMVIPVKGIYKRKQIFASSVEIIESNEEVVIDMTIGLNEEEEYQEGQVIAQLIVMPIAQVELEELQ